MRKVALAVGGVVLLLVLFAGSMQLASESGEVVVLRTLGPDGATHETRLWIVDDGGVSWLRAGSPKAGWLPRLEANPEVEVVRGGKTMLVRATPVPSARDRINALMAEKYGLANRWIGLVVRRDEATPVRLDLRAASS